MNEYLEGIYSITVYKLFPNTEEGKILHKKVMDYVRDMDKEINLVVELMVLKFHEENKKEAE